MIHKVVKVRKKFKKLYEQGEYIPLDVPGVKRKHIIAYGRQWDGFLGVTIDPRFLNSPVETGSLLFGEDIGLDTKILLPSSIPGVWREIYTDREVEYQGFIHGSEIFYDFPLKLLIGGEKE
jgi:(1->4)-alpha-D-glucan 1-alpha-D-glucosylmutase